MNFIVLFIIIFGTLSFRTVFAKVAQFYPSLYLCKATFTPNAILHIGVVATCHNMPHDRTVSGRACLASGRINLHTT